MKTVVITAGFFDRDYDEKLHFLLASAKKNNIAVQVYGRGEFFNFYHSKIIALAQFISTFQDEYTHVMYTDAADSLILSPLDLIEGRYLTFCAPLVVAAEKGCHPFGDLAEKFPPSPTPFRYINPGNFMGEIPVVLETLQKCMTYSNMNTNDQGPWMEALYQKRIEVTLDYRCELFQCMSDTNFDQDFGFPEGHFCNKVTTSFPKVVHFNGPKTPEKMAQLQDVFTKVLGGTP